MKNRIITISRQLGSGGREIGHRLAEREGFKYYDKELLALISRQSGITPEVIESYDEKPARSFLFSVAASTSYASFYSGIEMPLNQKIFLAQFDTIKKVAEEGECVIVGRCADYVLEDHPDVLKVFVFGRMEDRIKRTKEKHPSMSDSEIKKMINRSDKERTKYYDYFTGKEWGDARSYDLCINTSQISIEEAVEMIEKYY